MTTTAFASASAVRRLTLLGLSAGVAAVALLVPTTAASAATAPTTRSAASAPSIEDAVPGQCKAAKVTAQYANGKIPLSVLCPLRGTSAEFLRADAAYNFNRMSTAFAKRFGTPICVTDSYRSLKLQTSLFATKPKLAAKPGTSNHGWGVAADLCGGIEKFDTVRHNWLFENSPKFRWVHPTWAQKTGSRPEAWHFEFAPRADMVRDALGLPRVSGGYNGFQIGKITTTKQTSAMASAAAVAAGRELSPVDDV